MSLIVPIRTENLGPGVHKKPPVDRLIEGNPDIHVWDQDVSLDGRVRSGVASATAGTTQSIKDGVCEVIHILEGVVELTEDGKEPMVFRAGDTFVMKPGFKGTWKTIEDFRKIFIISA
jgi:uncharacterized protein